MPDPQPRDTQSNQAPPRRTESMLIYIVIHNTWILAYEEEKRSEGKEGV